MNKLNDGFELFHQLVERIGAGRESGHVIALRDLDPGLAVPGAADRVAALRHPAILLAVPARSIARADGPGKESRDRVVGHFEIPSGTSSCSRRRFR